MTVIEDPMAMLVLVMSAQEMNFTLSYSRYLQDGGKPIPDAVIGRCMDDLAKAKLISIWFDDELGMQTAKAEWPGMYWLGCFLPQGGMRHDRHPIRYVAD